MWRQGPYGVNITYIQKYMTRNAFKFMRRFTQFTDNSIRKVILFDPISKVLYTVVSFSNHFIPALVSSRRHYHLCIIDSVSHPPSYHHAATTVFVLSRCQYPRLCNYIVLASSTAVLYHIGPTHRRSVSYWSYPPSISIILPS